VGLAADGAFADLVEVPVTQLFRVPAGVPPRLAALAEPWRWGYTPPDAGTWLQVIGCW